MSDRRVYVASLSDYNAGRLHGVWVDVDACANAYEIGEQVAAMLARSVEPIAEEWAVHDYDGIPSSFGEWPNFAELVEWVGLADEYGEAFEAWWSAMDHDVDASKWEDLFTVQYSGEGDTERDAVETMLDDQGYFSGWPEEAVRYFDVDSYINDLDCGGMTFVYRDGSVFMFDGTVG